MAEATSFAIVDWLIELTFVARRHSLTLLWLLEQTCCFFICTLRRRPSGLCESHFRAFLECTSAAWRRAVIRTACDFFLNLKSDDQRVVLEPFQSAQLAASARQPVHSGGDDI